MEGKFPLNCIVDLRRGGIHRNETMFMLPSTEWTFDHPVMKHLALYNIVMFCNPFLLDWPNTDFEFCFLSVLQRSGLKRSNSLPLWHNPTEGPRAIVPLPNAFHWHIKLANVFVSWHGNPLIIGGQCRVMDLILGQFALKHLYCIFQCILWF